MSGNNKDLPPELERRVRELHALIKHYINPTKKSKAAFDKDVGQLTPEHMMELMAELMALEGKIPEEWDNLLEEHESRLQEIMSEAESLELKSALNTYLQRMSTEEDILKHTPEAKDLLEKIKRERQSFISKMIAESSEDEDSDDGEQDPSDGEDQEDGDDQSPSDSDDDGEDDEGDDGEPSESEDGDDGESSENSDGESSENSDSDSQSDSESSDQSDSDETSQSDQKDSDTSDQKPQDQSQQDASDGDDASDSEPENGDENDGDADDGEEEIDPESYADDMDDNADSQPQEDDGDGEGDDDSGGDGDEGEDGNDGDSDSDDDGDEGDDGDGQSDGDGDDEGDSDDDGHSYGFEQPEQPPQGTFQISDEDPDPVAVTKMLQSLQMLIARDPEEPTQAPRWNVEKLVRLMMEPGSDLTRAKEPTQIPQDVVFIFDNSGSMNEFEKAARRLAQAVGKAAEIGSTRVVSIVSSNGEFSKSLNGHDFAAGKNPFHPSARQNDDGGWYINGEFMGLLPYDPVSFASNDHCARWVWFLQKELPRKYGITPKVVLYFSDDHGSIQWCYMSNKLKEMEHIWLDPKMRKMPNGDDTSGATKWPKGTLPEDVKGITSDAMYDKDGGFEHLFRRFKGVYLSHVGGNTSNDYSMEDDVCRALKMVSGL